MLWITLTIIFLLTAAVGWKVKLGDIEKTTYNGSRTEKGVAWGIKGFPIVSLPVLAIWMLMTFFMSLYTIDAGHIGLIKTFREYTGQSGPGLHLKAPFQGVDEVNGRVQRATINMSGGDKGSAVSKETQPVYAKLSVNYRIELTEAKKLYTDVGPTYYDAIIEPRVQQAFKAITVKYLTVEIAPNREEIRDQAKGILTKQLEPYGIQVDDLLIKDLGFSQAFLDAIERKQVATEDAKAAKEKVAQKKAEAEQKIAEARGEAEAARINGQALENNPLALQKLAIEKLSPNVQVIMLPSNSQNMLLPPSLFGQTATK
jgi:regulator of protease activity HflC (stomatin/prohibitin superfamily)